METAQGKLSDERKSGTDDRWLKETRKVVGEELPCHVAEDAMLTASCKLGGKKSPDRDETPEQLPFGSEFCFRSSVVRLPRR